MFSNAFSILFFGDSKKGNSKMKKREFIDKYLLDSYLDKKEHDIQYYRQFNDDIIELKGSNLFYKYYSLADKYTIENILNKVIHFSDPNNFNDPFDSLFGLSVDDCLYKLIIDSIFGYLEENTFINSNQAKQLQIIFSCKNENNILDNLNINGLLDDLIDFDSQNMPIIISDTNIIVEKLRPLLINNKISVAQLERLSNEFSKIEDPEKLLLESDFLRKKLINKCVDEKYKTFFEKPTDFFYG